METIAYWPIRPLVTGRDGASQTFGQKQNATRFLYAGGLTSTLNIPAPVVGATALTVTASQPGFAMTDADMGLNIERAERVHLGSVLVAARVLRAGADSTLDGVVFAILCFGPCDAPSIARRRDARERAGGGAAPRPGHEWRLRRIDSVPTHHAQAHSQALSWNASEFR